MQQNLLEQIEGVITFLIAKKATAFLEWDIDQFDGRKTEDYQRAIQCLAGMIAYRDELIANTFDH
jgi:hypothetical protein